MTSTSPNKRIEVLNGYSHDVDEEEQILYGDNSVLRPVRASAKYCQQLKGVSGASSFYEAI